MIGASSQCRQAGDQEPCKSGAHTGDPEQKTNNGQGLDRTFFL